ncbi:MAG TPA: hypothetical protein VLU95_02705 [Candidatus Acidoferrum sp.]|nr:hypothetical protein [Candidatus Acidoferrum sp.]
MNYQGCRILSLPFTYLNTTVGTNAPLPPYQTATASVDASPPVNNAGTYAFIIQGLANNGTIYTYQTTITTHGF